MLARATPISLLVYFLHSGVAADGTMAISTPHCVGFRRTLFSCSHSQGVIDGIQLEVKLPVKGHLRPAIREPLVYRNDDELRLTKGIM